MKNVYPQLIKLLLLHHKFVLVLVHSHLNLNTFLALSNTISLLCDTNLYLSITDTTILGHPHCKQLL